jgi:mannose-binding lectin 2
MLSALFMFLWIGHVSGTEDKGKFFENDNSLTKPFNQQDLWDITGSTMISDKFIRLTSDTPSQSGSLWSKNPLRHYNWEIHLTFRVHGKGKTLFGDGFAMWYVQHRMQPGPVFGSKNGFRGLGVFFDTYSNHQGEHNHPHPYVSGMVSNGSLLYDHDNDGTHTQLDGCHYPFRNVDHDVGISVKYLDDVLTISTDIDNSQKWKKCMESEGVILPRNYFIGLSAVTGDLSDNHDITGVKVFSLKSNRPDFENEVRGRVRLVPSAAKFDIPRAHVESKESVASKTMRSPLKTFLIAVVVLVGAAFTIAIGYLFYKDREEKRLKRFY